MAETQKRTFDEVEDGKDVKAVVFSVEDTAVPASFWQDKLSQYVLDNVKAYLEAHWEEEDCVSDVSALREQANKDKEVDGCVEIPEVSEEVTKEAVIEAIVNNISWQMSEKRDSTILKQIQSRLWKEAFNADKMQGQVYDDVTEALKFWKSESKKVYTYSACADAQKLIFGHSNQGDLSEYLTGHFDDKTTGSEEKSSYSKIAELMELKPEEVLFVTARTNFAKEAASAGFKTSLVQRTEESSEEVKDFPVVSSFAEFTSSAAPETKKPATEETNGAEQAEEEHANGDGDKSAPAEEPEATEAASEEPTAEGDQQ